MGWLWALFPLIFVVIGVAAFTTSQRTIIKAMGIWTVLFASALTIAAQLGGWQQYQRLQRDFREGRFSDVEDRVTDFQADRDSEVFYVGGHRFYIRKPMITAAYNGGSILNRQCVRILYTERDEIIWIGVRRFGCVPMKTLQRDVRPPRMGWDP